MRVMTILSAAAIIMIQSAVWALIDPVALSGIQTVSPSGFADVGRNPALLPFNTETVSIGAAGSYTPIQNISGRDSAKPGQASDYDLTVDSSDPLLLSQCAGVMIRTANAGFGFSTMTDGDSTYGRQTTDTKLSGTITSYNSGTGTSSTTVMTQNAKEKTTTLNPGGSFSWGYRISDSFSWGIGIQGGYEKTTNDTFTASSGTANGTAFAESLKEKSTTTEYRGNISLGFLYRQDNIEAGLLITSADMSFGSIDYSYIVDKSTITMSAPSAADNTSASLPFNAGPPSVLLGFRIMTSYIDFVGEAGTLSSASQSITEISYDWSTGTIQKTTMDHQTGVNAVCRGGVIFHPGSVVRIILGGGYSAKAEKDYSNGNGSSDTETFTQTLLASGGIEFALGSHLTIGVAGIYGHLLIRGSSNVNQTTCLIRETANIVQASAGASLSF
jgi:hypothetical protein